MRMNGTARKALALCCAAALAALAFAAPKKDKIVVGASRSVTGPLAVFEQSAYGPIYKLWVKEINAQGGLFVKEYGKKLPLELKVYDDESDINKMVANLQKLMSVDKVDLVLPPAGTDMLFAAAPVFTQYGYVLMGAEGGASRLSEILAKYPVVFSVLNYSEHSQVPAMAELLADKKVKTVGIVYINDLHGLEYSNAASKAFKAKGMTVSMNKSVPVGVKNLVPLLKEAKDSGVDAFFCFGYPDENILALNQAIEIGFNPKLFLTGPGANFQFLSAMMGPAIEGVCGWGAWNPKSSPAHKEFAAKMAKEYGEGIFDWWGHNVYYASLQTLQQAIEKNGSLDQKKLLKTLSSDKFDTVLGKTWFDSKRLLAAECYAGEVGQWQKGVFEVVGPKAKKTAELVYPKPAWPAKQ